MPGDLRLAELKKARRIVVQREVGIRAHRHRQDGRGQGSCQLRDRVDLWLSGVREDRPIVRAG